MLPFLATPFLIVTVQPCIERTPIKKKSKILEKLTHKRLFQYLNKFDILNKHQFGFQKGKPTEHAILDLHTKIIKSVEKHEKACSIFLDFVKAFDTVNYDIILSKLEY